MLNIFASFSQLSRPILSLITAQFFLQLINAAFMQIFLIYMEKEGYADSVSGAFISYRFLGVLIFAIPLGLYIKKRPIKPTLYVGALLTPSLSLVTLYATACHYHQLITVSQLLWGISSACLQVAALPFIIRNSSEDNRVAALSLSYATWAFGGIASGLFIFGFSKLFPHSYNEFIALAILSVVGYISFFFILRINIVEHIPENHLDQAFNRSDILIILKASMPNLIIATGAGLTIPFIGLFFFKIHGLNSDIFAILSAVTTVLVSYSFLVVPYLNEKLGNKKAVLLSQTSAIILLALLATTEFYHHTSFSVFIAVFCFMFRQPLMNMAGPMTTDFTMKYVGPKNQEILSAINAAIWSGSWFISSRIFVFFRDQQIEYGFIFLITAMIYAIGVIWYLRLVKAYEKEHPAPSFKVSS